MNSAQRSAVSIDLLRRSLANGQAVRVKVISGSMEPLLQKRDTVVISGLTPEEVSTAIGEIITFVVGNELVTHRLISGDQTTFQTAADRSGAVDPARPVEDILGKVIARERRGASLAFTSGEGRQISQRRFRAVSRLIAIRRRLPPVLERPAVWIFRLLSFITAYFY